MTTAEMLRDIKAQRAARARYVVWSTALEHCALHLYAVGMDVLGDQLEDMARLLRKASASEAEPEDQPA